MSLSKEVATAQEAKGKKAEAPASTPKTEDVNIAGMTSKQKGEKFVATGRSELSNLSDEVKASFGANKADVEFKACLVDPTKKQAAKTTEAVSPNTVVGYRFKALKDIEVPVLPFKTQAKSLVDTLDAKTEKTFKTVKANEEFDLNLVETGIMITQTGYNGQFTGGGKTVTIQAKFAKDRADAMPVLKLADGSIKSQQIETSTKENGKVVCLPEFQEKFGAYYAGRTAGRKGKGTASQKKTGENTSIIAAAFRQLYGTN